MKKTITAILVALLTMNMVFVSVCADTDTNNEKVEISGFNDYKWGTSLEEIHKQEVPESMVANIDYGLEDGLLFLLNQKVAGYGCTTYYKFNKDNKLIGGTYILNESHTNEQQYYNDYVSLKKKLTSIYGEPEVNDNLTWSGDLYKDKQDKWGMAIITGELRIDNLWVDDSGDAIQFFIYGDNFECDTGLIYHSKEDLATDSDNTEGL